MENNHKIRILAFDGTVVEGEITQLDKHFIEVSITSPFINWKNWLGISGPARANPKNFLFRYKEVSEDLLQKSYKTLKKLDDSIERYGEIFKKHLEEKEALKSIEDIEEREIIERKLEDWFFNDFEYVSIPQRERFNYILKEYIDNKSKLYLQSRNHPD